MQRCVLQFISSYMTFYISTLHIASYCFVESRHQKSWNNTQITILFKEQACFYGYSEKFWSSILSFFTKIMEWSG